MPKKKKKSRASAGGSGDSSSSVAAAGGPSSMTTTPLKSTPQAPPVEPVDILSLQLASLSQSSSLFTGVKKSLKYAPTLFLHESDAERLDVVAGDKVFVLGYRMNENDGKEGKPPSTTKIVKSAIAKVKIINDAATDQHQTPGTPRTPLFKKSGGKARPSRPGSCHLHPSSLADSFFLATKNENDEDKRDDTKALSTPKQSATPSSATQSVTPSSATPSSSKSKFSFAVGGGWDNALATPSPFSKQQYRTPSSARSNSKHTQAQAAEVWVVPVDSDIGDRHSSALCRSAKSVMLCECHDTSNNIESENAVEIQSDKLPKRRFGPLAKRLVIAHTAGEFLSCDTPVVISMQGQKTKFRVSEATTCTALSNEEVQETTKAIESEDGNAKDDDLVSSMEQLTLQDSALETCVTMALQSLTDKERKTLMLHEITHSTAIEFSETCDENDVPEKLSDNAASAATSTDPKPLVAGLDSVVAQVQSALEVPLLHPELFYNNGDNSQVCFLRPPKGILLHGPSGVGKSSLALQVGQNLESTGNFHLERIHCTALQSQTAFVGQAERELVKLFDRAQARRQGKKGCLLILDDIHLICPRRQGTDLGADRLASTLLALLDGIGTESGGDNNAIETPTVILAVTTNPGMLDAALRRPGRLDSEIEVPVPDEPATRAQILRFHFDDLGANTTDFAGSDWLSLARRAKGFTGADLKLAAKEALRKCALSNQDGEDTVVTLDILQQAIASVKPSAIKAVTVEVPRVPWSSIGGMEEVKTQLREAIELPLTHGAMFQKLGIRPPRGVLLYGPPGCSKTLMARALATEGHMNFLAIKGPELLSKWLGESERALAALFRRARLASPAVIFFDEVDAIASKRGGGGGGGERLLSQLLTELDGIQHGGNTSVGEGGGRVVIVCATNRPDLLDGALMRPGRIDRMIYVGVPDEKSRERILRIGLKGKSCSDDIDFSRLVDERVSGGLSGAELIAACHDSALKAMEEFEDANEKQGEKEEDTILQDPIIRMDHLVSTLVEMERQITPDMLEFYASFQGKSLAKQ